MLGNARVYKQSKNSYAITIPASVVKALGIKQGNRVEFDMQNPRPEMVEEMTSGKRFPTEAKGGSKTASVSGTQSSYVKSPEPAKVLVRKIDYSKPSDEDVEKLISYLRNPKEYRKADDLVSELANVDNWSNEEIINLPGVKEAYETKKKREEYFARRDAA